MDILEDVRVLFRVPIGRVGQPSRELGEDLGLSLFSEVVVDGGTGGGEGNALDNGGGLHGVCSFRTGRQVGRVRCASVPSVTSIL